ncbi:winged helix-turn-helix domain-containing protein [Devosia ginsengisoli]|nr:winged helix-turn-helix domain-containing protein [Devosia ginsengisoli]
MSDQPGTAKTNASLSLLTARAMLSSVATCVEEGGNVVALDRTEESVVELLVLEALADGRVRTNQQIKAKLQKWTGWTATDLARSGSREDEPKWHSSVNNVLTDERGLYAGGCVARKGRGKHQITDQGLVRLKQNEVWRNAIREAFDPKPQC